MGIGQLAEQASITDAVGRKYYGCHRFGRTPQEWRIVGLLQGATTELVEANLRPTFRPDLVMLVGGRAPAGSPEAGSPSLHWHGRWVRLEANQSARVRSSHTPGSRLPRHTTRSRRKSDWSSQSWIRLLSCVGCHTFLGPIVSLPWASSSIGY